MVPFLLFLAFLVPHPAAHARTYRVPLPVTVLGVHSTSVNAADDIAGLPAPAPLWGSQGAIATSIQFECPAGYRVRVLTVDGDLIAWPKYPAVMTGTDSAEVGWGLKTTAPDGSSLVSFPGTPYTTYDNSFVWVQDSLTAARPNTRASFSRNVAAGGLLGPDNIMLSQVFVALNTSGAVIHVEPTYTITFQFEAE